MTVVAKPTVTNTPGTPFARIVAGAKTEDQQLRALEAAAQSQSRSPRMRSSSVSPRPLLPARMAGRS